MTASSTGPWQRVPLHWSVDLERGGRWTSLRTDHREWLWTNPDAAIVARRANLGPAPEPPFVDAGGGEECWPTVRGEPDHGAAWSRAWSGRPEDGEVAVPGLGALRRAIKGSDTVEVEYEVSGRPGLGFLHALHLLLDVGPDARLVVPGTPVARDLDDDGPARPWPDGLDRLGPDDGSAVCVLLADTASVTVVDGRHALRLSWSSQHQPGHCALLLWRNLRGWPEQQPYRSIGVEPLLGRAADHRMAAANELARVGPAGVTRWNVAIEAFMDPSSSAP